MKICRHIDLPKNTLIMRDIEAIDYYDSFSIKKKSDYPIDEITTKILTLPVWIKMLLKIRYYIVVIPFGLNSGKKAVPILYKNENEIVIGENEKHLYYRVSVLKKAEPDQRFYLTTVVKFNNKWGKVYFTLIKPFHYLVVKSMLMKI